MINDALKTSRELFSDARQAISERIKLTILVFYTIAFPLYNWDIFLFVLSESLNTIEKVNCIATLLHSNYISRIGIPLIIAVSSPLFFTWIQIKVNTVIAQVQKGEIKRIREEEIETAKHKKAVNDKIRGEQTEQERDERIKTLEALNMSHSNDKRALTEQLENKELQIADSLEEIRIQNDAYEKLESDYVSLTKKYEQLAGSNSYNEVSEDEIKLRLEQLITFANSLSGVDRASLLKFISLYATSMESYDPGRDWTAISESNKLGDLLSFMMEIGLIQYIYSEERERYIYKKTPLGGSIFSRFYNEFNRSI